MSKKADVKTFVMRDIKTVKDLEALRPEFDFKVFETTKDNIPINYMLWGSNCRALVGVNHETREDMYDTFEHLFFYKSPKQEINPLVRMISHGGRVYGGHTYYHCLYNENYFESDFLDDYSIINIEKEIAAPDQAEEVTAKYKEVILDKLNQEYVNVAENTIFDYCLMYNWAVFSEEFERRKQFLLAYPNFYEFYQAFAMKYMLLSLYKVANGYTVYRKDLTSQEKINKNQELKYIFDDIENMIDNGETASEIIDLVLNNPPIKFALKEDEANKTWFDAEAPNAKFAFNAVAVDNIFGFTPCEYYEKSNFYDGVENLMSVDPNHYHLFEGKFQNLVNIHKLLGALGGIDNRLQIDINTFLGKCDKKYIDLMTDTHTDTLINDVINVVKRYTDMDSTSMLMERLINRNSMKLWYNLNEKYHEFAPYLSDFEYALSNVLNRCYEVPLTEKNKLFDKKIYDKHLKKAIDGIEVKQLLMVDDFKQEGDDMKHCVSGYYTNCVGRARFIFSFKDTSANERSTCEIGFDGNSFSVRQHYGVNNSRSFGKKLHNLGDAICTYLSESKELRKDIEKLYQNSDDSRNSRDMASDAKTVIMLTKFFVPQLFKDKNVQLAILDSFKKEFDSSRLEVDKFNGFMQDTIDAIRIKMGLPIESHESGNYQDDESGDVNAEDVNDTDIPAMKKSSGKSGIFGLGKIKNILS